MSLVNRAYKLAEAAHKGQFRRDGVTPYFHHPLEVARRLARDDEEGRATALLHDVIEDTTYEVQHLRAEGIPENIIRAVELLTKSRLPKDMDPAEAYDAYLHGVASDPIARRVKIADMLANLADAPTKNQILKYAKGLLFLVQIGE